MKGQSRSAGNMDGGWLIIPVAMFGRYYGGWAAPNIYFLGFAGVIKFGNIRIGGLSGIYNARHYKLGHFERPPYSESDIRSIYHVREYDVYKLLQIEEPIDIFLSHDWPIGITDCGNWRELVRKKPFFEKEIQERALGSKPAAELLEKLKPLYWFSAHLHCKFAALVQHGDGGPITKFLALDKCLPGRKFLQVIEIQSDPGPFEIEYDEEWLTITRIFNSAFPATSKPADLGCVTQPSCLCSHWLLLFVVLLILIFTTISCRKRSVQVDKDDSRRWVRSRLEASGAKPFAFARTAPCYDPSQSNANSHAPGNHLLFMDDLFTILTS
ncbi:hypothetical protein Cgig2_008278 [Carnegiea gigantea]|uniref:Lariat debranching enzyme C-terminal domain-containing protein n=1 Tax=Carnegiea gigantea TaxID=171969 RepID=A0A9Q1L132_9CARY|nr:hypothetical protein Cgig2_008278 [Carnegiea gigantea]